MPVRALGGSEAEHRRLDLFVRLLALFHRPPNIKLWVVVQKVCCNKN